MLTMLFVAWFSLVSSGGGDDDMREESMTSSTWLPLAPLPFLMLLLLRRRIVSTTELLNYADFQVYEEVEQVSKGLTKYDETKRGSEAKKFFSVFSKF